MLYGSEFRVLVYVPNGPAPESPFNLPPGAVAVLTWVDPVINVPYGLRRALLYGVDPIAAGLTVDEVLDCNSYVLEALGPIRNIWRCREKVGHTIRDVVSRTGKELRAAGLGPKGVDRIREALTRLGLNLVDDPPIPKFRVVTSCAVSGATTVLAEGLMEHSAKGRATREAEALAYATGKPVEAYGSGYRVCPTRIEIQPL